MESYFTAQPLFTLSVMGQFKVKNTSYGNLFRVANFQFYSSFFWLRTKNWFWRSFFLSLILSPLIGLIITAFSESIENEVYKKTMMKTQKKQKDALEKLSENIENNSIAEEIMKLGKLKEDNLITEDEYHNLKNKVINSTQNAQKGEENINLDTNNPKQNKSINNFEISIYDVEIPLKIKKKLPESISTLMYHIQEIERSITLYGSNEYPFYAAMVLDNKNKKLTPELIDNLIATAKNYYNEDSINGVLHKLKKVENKN